MSDSGPVSDISAWLLDRRFSSRSGLQATIAAMEAALPLPTFTRRGLPTRRNGADMDVVIIDEPRNQLQIALEASSALFC